MSVEDKEPYREPQMVIETEDRLTSKLRPHDVKISSTGAAGCFGKYEIEKTAGILARFFQRRDCWHLFRLEEFLSFAKANNFNGGLFGLMGPWLDDSMMGGVAQFREAFLVSFSNGTVCVTKAFLEQLEKGAR